MVFESIVVDLPEQALRSVPDTGLQLRIRLDNGHEVLATAPAAYVRGYLLAVDAPR